VAYQKVNKGPRYASTGSIIKPGQMVGLRTAAAQYKAYLAGLMKALQNRARQEVFKSRPFAGRCQLCGETDTSKFYVTYDSPPQTMDLCQSHHKEMSQHRGTIYSQLVRHNLKPLSWEEWKNGVRPVNSAESGNRSSKGSE
jgi:hypothetical protein